MERVYLDYNATTPLRAEARAAMISAMDVVGNPSSVHGEGRAAKAMIEGARAQIAHAFGAQDAEIVFVASATEAAALAMAGRGLLCGDVEHDAVLAWAAGQLDVNAEGGVMVEAPETSVVQLANSETGVVQELPRGLAMSDMTQAFGKIDVGFDNSDVSMALISAHKLGGPKGIGALIMRRGIDIGVQIKGGGQEMGRRAGTENVIGIAGFGAAAEAANRDLRAGMWKHVAEMRNLLETTIAASAKEAIFVGQHVERLPNTSCIVRPGWKGETQVMQMDLAGFAISAGSACSSGKVRASKVLRAMGFDEVEAASAIRVSLGLGTTRDDILRFAEAWIAQHEKYCARAA